MLAIAAAIYEKVIDARNRRFDAGRTAAHDLGARTISIGNITAGGTGKTPLVIKTAGFLAERGKRVCVITRGYGRQNPKTRLLVSDGRSVLAEAKTAGDEAVELAKRLVGKAIVIADADRVRAAEWARTEFGVNAFVLDDSFQHRYAKRDVDIVCIDALDPFGGGKMLPAGRLREPLKGLARATAVVITRSDLVGDGVVADLRLEIARYAPSIPIFASTVSMRNMVELNVFTGTSNAPADYSAIANRKAYAFCGLGNPRVFFDQLRRDNFELAGETAFADHYKYAERDIEKMEKQARSCGAAFLLTTAKDAVKLAGLRLDLPCFVVEIDIRIDDEAGFAALL